MDRFSDDGIWWWDGATWLATSSVVIPDLGLPAGSEAIARNARPYQDLVGANEIANSIGISPTPDSLQLLGAGLLVTDVVLFHRTFRALRELKLAQITQATAFLLGPDEPILAAEPSLYTALPPGFLRGLFSVVVTRAHVLVLQGAVPLEAPRWVSMAARPRDVDIRADLRRWLGLFPAVMVTHRGRTWRVVGVPKVFQPQAVLDAWRTAAGVTATTR